MLHFVWSKENANKLIKSVFEVDVDSDEFNYDFAWWHLTEHNRQYKSRTLKWMIVNIENLIVFKKLF